MFSGFVVINVLVILLSIVGTVLLCVFFMPEKNKNKYGKFGTFMHNLINFNTLFVETVLKIVYIFATLATIFYGFFTMFTPLFSRYIHAEVTLTGLLTLILGPIVIRIVYELIMLMIILTNKVIAINNRLSNDTSDINITGSFSDIKNAFVSDTTEEKPAEVSSENTNTDL